MTFIATVIAKNGAAVIADSLVTTSHPTLDFEEFITYLDSKNGNSEKKAIHLDPKEIIELFQTRPHHTKDFEEKLFKYDDYTAITTSGSAILNDKGIGEIISEISEKNDGLRGYKNKKILTKVKDLVNELSKHVRDHLKKHLSVRDTTLIMTNYNKSKNETKVYKINIHSASSKKLDEENFELVRFKETTDYEKVICEGQNRISDRILYGDIPTVLSLIPKVVRQVANDFDIDKSKINSDYIKGIRDNKDIVPSSAVKDMKILSLTELSLQQATELAALLMRLEMDIQSYTEDIPTVGGVIKLAVIDKYGFRYITGDDISRPSNI